VTLSIGIDRHPFVLFDAQSGGLRDGWVFSIHVFLGL
jgi:hypothetical protein